MKRIMMLGMATAMLLLGTACFAYPTLGGPTGQAVIPTAYTAAPGLTLAADWQQLEEGSAIPIRALFGIGSNVEIGAMYTTFNDDAILPMPFVSDMTDVLLGFPADKMWGANAKWRFGRFLGGDAALGAQFQRFTPDIDIDLDTDFSQAYFAWSTMLSNAPSIFADSTFSWGVNWTKMKRDEFILVVDEEPFLVPEYDENAVRLFAGLMLVLSDSIALEGEFQTKSEKLGDQDPLTALTARFAISPNFTLQAGWTNAAPGGMFATSDHNFFAGLAFTTTACED